jgi:nitroreductase
MKALDLLLNRQSNPLLQSPAPTLEQLNTILAAGMRVPDHAGLQPWHFTVVKEGGLDKLGQLFVDTLTEQGAEQAKIDKAAKMPFRAPVIIVISTNYQAHEKVPAKEQLITAGCCVHAMQMAATALGFGAMWRTGAFSEERGVKLGLNIGVEQDIVGFLYIGSKTKELPCKPTKTFETFVSDF